MKNKLLKFRLAFLLATLYGLISLFYFIYSYPEHQVALDFKSNAVPLLLVNSLLTTFIFHCTIFFIGVMYKILLKGFKIKSRLSTNYVLVVYSMLVSTPFWFSYSTLKIGYVVFIVMFFYLAKKVYKYPTHT